MTPGQPEERPEAPTPEGTPKEPENTGEAAAREDDGGAHVGDAAGQAPRVKPKPKRKADQDPDEVLQYTELPVASVDELRSALAWAFDGEDIPSAVLDKFAAHARLVLEGNQVMNLTSIVDPKEVAAKHYLDSWRSTRLLPLMGRSVLDLGTGAGFPGVPVALAEPQAKVGLVDSTKKRIEFVEKCLAELGVKGASAHWERAEEHLTRHEYDLVLVRAVSSVRENVRILRKVKHSLKDLVMLKGPSWSREARAAEREAERLGFRLDTVWEHELPGEMGKRAILVYRAPGGHGL